MSDNNDGAVQNLLAKLALQRDEAERTLDALEGDGDAPPLSDEDRATGARMVWILRAAAAHSEGAMPWRANPPTPEDADWCLQVCYAVSDKTARPAHPDPEIEQMLLDALPT